MRTEKNWTQEEAAEKLHISSNAYGCIERGETRPNLKRLEQIAKLFDVGMEELVSDKSILNIGMGSSSNFNCYNTFNSEQLVELQHELEKVRFLLEQKDKEIDNLKQQNADLREIVGLLKK